MTDPIGAPFPFLRASRRDTTLARRHGRKETITGEGWSLTAYKWKGIIYITSIRKQAKRKKRKGKA